MGKKKLPAPGKLNELVACGRNPRKISAVAQGGLGCSMERFGDLSGIVFNGRLNELVAGHQRVDRLRETWGDLVIEPVDDDHGRILAPGGQVWPVRFVAWPRAKHDAAMIAANSPAISGEYTDDLQTLLADVQTEAADLYDELLFEDLLAKSREDNVVLPGAELEERRTCTLSWPVEQDDVIRQFLALDEKAGLPEELGHALFERIRLMVADAGRTKVHPTGKKSLRK